MAIIFICLPAWTFAVDSNPDRQTWEAFVDQFIESFFVAHPTFAVRAGRHEYDGQLPNWSREGIAREIDRLKALRDQAKAYGRSALSAEQRFQQAYVLVIINSLLFVLDDAEEPFRSPTFYLAWPDTLDPGYLNYTLGKLLIRQLRDDWVADRGGRKAWRQFHDTFLSFGGPPIPLVREQMMGAKK